MKLVKALINLHDGDGNVTKVGQTTNLSAAEAESLAKRGFITILGDAPAAEPAAPAEPAKPKGKGKTAGTPPAGMTDPAGTPPAGMTDPAGDPAGTGDGTGDGAKAEDADNGGGV